MRNTRHSGKRHTDRMFRATSTTTPPNQLMIAVHAMPGNDGCEPIVDYLRIRRDVLSRTNPITNLTLERDRRFVLEGPHGMTAADVVAENRIPPQFVTHVLLLVPGMYGALDDAAMIGDIPSLIRANQPTAFGLGRIDLFDSEARNARTYDELPETARRVVAYFESYFDRAVLFIGTGPQTVIDRSAGYAAPGT